MTGSVPGKDDPGALPVHRVGNGELELAFLPSVGGRLISVRCRGAELLWRNPEYLDADLGTVRPRSAWAPLDGSMGSWANVGGSKTWPAPQGWSGAHEWPGPPDGVLDAGTWAWEDEIRADGTRVVRLTSPDDSRTGLRVVREVTLPPDGTAFRQRNIFRNVSDRDVSWSVWEVCQVDTEQLAGVAAGSEGDLWVGVTGDTAPVSLVEATGAVRVGPARGGVRQVEVDDVVAKVGFSDADGTLGLRRPDGVEMRWSFEVVAGSYPDGGCQVELWMQYPTAGPLGGLNGLHPSSRLVELEALSPLTDLAPGDEVSLVIDWEIVGPA